MTDNIQTLKKKNVWLVILLSIITVGIYIGYWFLSAKSSFQLINKNNYIPFKWWMVATIYLSLSVILSLIGEFILSIYGLYILDSIDLIFAYFFLGLLYYSIFRIKELLEKHDDEMKMNKYLLFFFHIWYIQYKINQSIKREGGK
ncbi:DUF4234 domain-containing protein [Oceanobacillus salinisoli]|uniref:DUF4234 domain-containing protein n=1 Tax=Oceanobacillus salinisoli TaxID=2678611 RepID=UPI0012E2F862|nr:DUF4234 domain-containing protein [Oceanobacillus salinisoli]